MTAFLLVLNYVGISTTKLNFIQYNIYYENLCFFLSLQDFNVEGESTWPIMVNAHDSRYLAYKRRDWQLSYNSCKFVQSTDNVSSGHNYYTFLTLLITIMHFASWHVRICMMHALCLTHHHHVPFKRQTIILTLCEREMHILHALRTPPGSSNILQ